jgi:hypothetical protein
MGDDGVGECLRGEEDGVAIGDMMLRSERGVVGVRSGRSKGGSDKGSIEDAELRINCNPRIHGG